MGDRGVATNICDKCGHDKEEHFGHKRSCEAPYCTCDSFVMRYFPKKAEDQRR